MSKCKVVPLFTSLKSGNEMIGLSDEIGDWQLGFNASREGGDLRSVRPVWVALGGASETVR